MKGFKTFRRFSCILAAFIVLCTGILPAQSATINVTVSATDKLNGADGQCSLREAITNINNAATTYADCAPSGAYGTSDTINIPAGTYTTTLAGLELLNASGSYDILKSVAIVGAGASTTTINGGGLDRVFVIDPAGDAGVAVSISGVTITGGNSIYSGGGIGNSYGAKLTVTNSTITGNTSDAGGGIYSEGTLAVTNSTITSNTTTSGGGINSYGTANVTNSTISGNSATSYGGGISNSGGTLTVTNSTISGNKVTGSYGGGGIYNSNTLTVTNSTITGNTAYSDGGGIYSYNGFFTVTNSTIASNTAVTSGGGISASKCIFTVTNSTIADNSASFGGGIYALDSTNTVTVTNSTISGNSATSYGGGIYSSNGGVLLSNNVVANQTLGSDCHGQSSSGDHNLSSDASCWFFTSAGDKQNTNPLLGALASNGGPTQTMALLAGSPAIDAGSCVQATDQRGTARPQGAGCDIGAYELASPSTQNNCAASVSSSLVVNIPIITYSGSNYWADLQYNSTTGQLTIANAGAVTDASSYSSCTASTLSSDFKLHVPVVMLSGVSYWLDLQWNGSVFVITGGGAN